MNAVMQNLDLVFFAVLFVIGYFAFAGRRAGAA